MTGNSVRTWYFIDFQFDRLCLINLKLTVTITKSNSHTKTKNISLTKGKHLVLYTQKNY